MHPVDPSLITDGSTFINPLGLVFTLAMCVLLLVLPRKYALFPILALVCYMTMGMRVMVADLNFTMIRILLVFAWARLLLRGEFRRIQLNTLDKVVIAMTYLEPHSVHTPLANRRRLQMETRRGLQPARHLFLLPHFLARRSRRHPGAQDFSLRGPASRGRDVLGKPHRPQSVRHLWRRARDNLRSR